MNRIWRRAGALFFGMNFALVTTAGCADEPPATPPALSAYCEAPAGDIAMPEPLPHLAAALENKKTIRVLAIGSSSTIGTGAPFAQLEHILEKAFKGVQLTIINRGVSGEVAATTAERLKLEVALEKPDLVLWQVGTNDALARVPVEEFVETVRDALRWLKEHRIDTVLVGLRYTPRLVRDEQYAAIREALRLLAVSENVLLVRRLEATQFIERAKQTDLSSDDDLHLDSLGYRCMAEYIARAVVVGAFLVPRVR